MAQSVDPVIEHVRAVSRTWRVRRRKEIEALIRSFDFYYPCTYEQAVKDVQAAKEAK